MAYLSRYLPKELRKRKTTIGTANFPAENRTEHLLNTRSEPYCYVNPLSH
jgi:hypothetical protein